MQTKHSISPSALIDSSAVIGENVVIGPGVIIGENVTIGDNCYIDTGAILRNHVTIGNDSYVGGQCILGELLSDFFSDRIPKEHPLRVGAHALIRSGSILYGGSRIGDFFQTGHRVTVREKSCIGDHVNLGTLSDVQGDCVIEDYVHMHSNVHIGMKTHIEKYAWIFPYVVCTNDPTPPSEVLKGAHIGQFAVVCTGALLLPGVQIGKDALVAAGTVVTKDVPEMAIVKGNPGKVSGQVTRVLNEKGEQVYPWRYSFKRGMPWQDSDYQSYISRLTEEQKAE